MIADVSGWLDGPQECVSFCTNDYEYTKERIYFPVARRKRTKKSSGIGVDQYINLLMCMQELVILRDNAKNFALRLILQVLEPLWFTIQ